MNSQLPRLEVAPNLCKACQLCVDHCPPKCIETNPENAFNVLGYQWVQYTGDGCTGCGVCYYMCPEPGAITVYKRERKTANA